MSEVSINKHNKSIEITRDDIAFSQFGIADEISDLIIEQGMEIERLNNDIKELFKENSNKEKVIIAQDNIIKEVREKIKNFNVYEEFTFPLMTTEEEFQVKSSIDYEWRKSIKEPILEILDKEKE